MNLNKHKILGIRVTLTTSLTFILCSLVTLLISSPSLLLANSDEYVVEGADSESPEYVAKEYNKETSYKIFEGEFTFQGKPLIVHFQEFRTKPSTLNIEYDGQSYYFSQEGFSFQEDLAITSNIETGVTTLYVVALDTKQEIPVYLRLTINQNKRTVIAFERRNTMLPLGFFSGESVKLNYLASANEWGNLASSIDELRPSTLMGNPESKEYNILDFRNAISERLEVKSYVETQKLEGRYTNSDGQTPRSFVLSLLKNPDGSNRFSLAVEEKAKDRKGIEVVTDTILVPGYNLYIYEQGQYVYVIGTGVYKQTHFYQSEAGKSTESGVLQITFHKTSRKIAELKMLVIDYVYDTRVLEKLSPGVWIPAIHFGIIDSDERSLLYAKNLTPQTSEKKEGN